MTARVKTIGAILKGLTLEVIKEQSNGLSDEELADSIEKSLAKHPPNKTPDSTETYYLFKSIAARLRRANNGPLESN